ncbi:MAG: 2-oxoacid:acceptor oxidoreductase family protein, partial [Oligoflexales bacterium]|nr:2-oxoacid:acceptor oxidoreductase family protein [Oligoflexales bacterium]
LELAGKGEFTALLVEGDCIHETRKEMRERTLGIDEARCTRCGLCKVCPGIDADEKKLPFFTSRCTNCGSNNQVCRQRCKSGAIIKMERAERHVSEAKLDSKISITGGVQIKREDLPKSIRIAIRGIGGQGNLFIGKVLAEIALRTPYSGEYIVKGDTHGMAQLGGPVISTFACGAVHSPIFAPKTADVLVAMEMAEIMRPGFLQLLKPGGTVIFNRFKALPPNAKASEYPSDDEIEEAMKSCRVIKVDANQIAYKHGDETGRAANLVILGLLSKIEPLNVIPPDIWISVLMSLSENEKTKIMNYTLFQEGRAF